MPVSYKHMPELRSDSPEAFDQASGARFSDIDRHREHGLSLLNFLHRRGAKVWQWVPVGCVPSTYAQAHPEAMSPGNPTFPCFTHPLYRQYLEAYAKELLETYAIDGVVMIRDDNGGICDCDRCKAYVAASRTLPTTPDRRPPLQCSPGERLLPSASPSSALLSCGRCFPIASTAFSILWYTA